MSSFSNPEWSYARHQNHEQDQGQTEELPSCYTAPESIDAWRHRRMRENLLPLIKQFPASTWLTVGDGRFGCDANYLEKQGLDVVASSLTDNTLVQAKGQGFIKKYRDLNAEEMDFPDSSFDFVLCKEAFHHFPRPALGFYQMLRVCRQAMILIEPIEDNRLFNQMKNWVKVAIRGDKSFLFEECGNFIYRVRIPEVEKMLTALNYRYLAYKKFNDFYHPRISHSKYSTLSYKTILTKMGLGVQNSLCATGLLGHGLATVICFKVEPTSELQRDLRQCGFRVKVLPRNPYLPEEEAVKNLIP